MLDSKKFFSPTQLRRRFNISLFEYNTFVEAGMPTYTCAGVVRHPIDEVYLWCENNRVHLQDQNDLCSARQIRELLGISAKNLEDWEKMGLPKKIYKTRRFPRILYDKNDVISWLKTQSQKAGV